MKKIILILIILVLISGCVKIPKLKLPGSSQTTTGKSDFIGGTKGIEAGILSPIEGGKIYSTQPLNVVVGVTNEGESESEGTTCISGLNKKYFPGFWGCECQDFTLEGRRLIEGERLEGEEEQLTFEIGTINPEGLEGSTVTSKTRYDYKTYGIIKACVKKDAYSEEGCKITGKNMIKSASSAPVGIVEVTEDIISETEETAKIIFNIKLKNSGKGKLYSLDEDKDQCETPVDLKKNINLRLINAPGRSHCNTVELKKDEATAQCTITNVKVLGESYEPEITVELEYSYETIDSNIFEVKWWKKY